MPNAETIISFIIGACLILFAGFIFSLKTKGLFRVVLNTIVGGVLLVVLSLVTPLSLPLNPFNALITGFLGIGGVLVVICLVYLL